MDKYQELRVRGEELSRHITHRTTKDAELMAANAGFAFRYVHVDGQAMMITADVRMDRLCFTAYGGIITRCTVG